MNNLHIFNDVARHATAQATERMLMIIDAGLDDDVQRMGAALSVAQSVYISMVKAMLSHGIIGKDVADESLRFVNETVNKIVEERCAKSSHN